MLESVVIMALGLALVWAGRTIGRQDREIVNLHRSFANVYRENDTLTEAGWRTEVCDWMTDAATFFREEADCESNDVGDRLRASLKATTIMEMIEGVQKKRYKAVTSQEA